jgi:cell division protein FtsL
MLLFFVVITIPVFLGLNAWQSSRYIALERETLRFEDAQEEWIESNKRLIGAIAVLSSSRRIEHIAKNDLELTKIEPEDVLQVKITGGKGNDG